MSEPVWNLEDSTYHVRIGFDLADGLDVDDWLPKIKEVVEEIEHTSGEFYGISVAAGVLPEVEVCGDLTSDGGSDDGETAARDLAEAIRGIEGLEIEDMRVELRRETEESRELEGREGGWRLLLA